MQQEKFKCHAFRLKPGQDLKKEIEAFAQNETIKAGWILSCVGSLTKAHLRFANATNGVTLDGYFEIISLSGTVSINGCHLHISISDPMGKTIGGHLMGENIIFTTAEIIIGESCELLFTRENDGTTQWKELQVKPKDPGLNI
ncbi:MAG TPA: PPC domain-containing DNA-binding protein [Ferruginibacter sp.]|nr:PPC domain-containing DNA-binding protein [Ferruginibacter sp.]